MSNTLVFNKTNIKNFKPINATEITKASTTLTNTAKYYCIVESEVM